MSRPDRPEVARILPGLFTWLVDHGYRMIIDQQTGKYIDGLEVMPRAQMASEKLDLVIVLGGDGTLLSAARVTAAIDVPLLGVNLGHLGFLTEVPPESLYTMLEAIAQGDVEMKQRAFFHAFNELQQRLRIFVSLPVERLDRPGLQEELDEIGRQRLVTTAA